MAEKKGKKKESVKKEDTKSLKEALRDLSLRGRVLLALFTSLTVATLLFLFLFALLNAVTPDYIEKEDYITLLSKLNNRTWTIKKGDEKTLSPFLSGFKASGAKSEKSGTVLILRLKGEEKEHVLHFSYRDDRIQGFVGSSLFSLFPSEGKDGKNGVLTLISSEAKIVFYEE